MVNPVTTGEAIMVCAIIIAFGEYIILINPSGPLRQRKIETTNPTTTGGKAIPVLIKLIQKDLERNFINAKKEPRGKPTPRLINVASPEIFNG